MLMPQIIQLGLQNKLSGSALYLIKHIFTIFMQLASMIFIELLALI